MNGNDLDEVISYLGNSLKIAKDLRSHIDGNSEFDPPHDLVILDIVWGLLPEEP